MQKIVLILLLLIFSISSQAQVRITTTLKPIADIVKEVSGDKAEVNYLIPPSVNFHIYEYKTSDIRKISESDLFIYIGYGEPSIRGIVKNIPKGKSFQITSLKGLHLIRDTDHDEIHPALWLDPENGKIIAKFALEYLSGKDPKNRDYYQANYDRFVVEVDRLVHYGKERLSSLKNKNFVSYHYEFPYFVNRFGLFYLADIEMGHGREPSPKHLLQVIQKIKSNNVKSIFTSKQLSNKRILDLVVSKTGVKVIFLDSQGESSSYLQMMKFNIERVYEGLNY